MGRSSSGKTPALIGPWINQLTSRFKDRLIRVPLFFVAGALALSQVTLGIDRNVSEDALPHVLKTTVDSADSVLSTIAGGLITAVTLLLSLVLVSVQLASSQFSPRTVRDWIGDRTQQRTIGVVLGTVVFCLMALRETRASGDAFSLAPHISVLVAVALAVISLVAVVRSVDHLSNSMRIGSVARNLAADTREALRGLEDHLPIDANANDQVAAHNRLTSGTPLTAPTAGWVQRIDLDRLVSALPAHCHVSLLVGPGAFVFDGQPVAWVATDHELSDDITRTLFEIGDTRLVDHDVSYGLLQMSDIALRALSPGVNDPNTAADVIVYMGTVLLEAWRQHPATTHVEIDGRIVDLIVASHADYLNSAFAQILRYADDEFDVLATMHRTISTIASEAERRELPGPLEPLHEMLSEVETMVEQSSLTDRSRGRFDAAARPAVSGTAVA